MKKMEIKKYNNPILEKRGDATCDKAICDMDHKGGEKLCDLEIQGLVSNILLLYGDNGDYYNIKFSPLDVLKLMSQLVGQEKHKEEMSK